MSSQHLDYDQADSQDYAKKFSRGLSEELVREISAKKNEPEWLLDIRLKAFAKFQEMEMPKWGPSLKNLDLDKIRYYTQASDKKSAKNWDEVDPQIKATFERLKIPEAERHYLAGSGAQYESETVYHKLKDTWETRGVIFLDLDEAVKRYPEIVRKYFAKCVPITDHKFAALHYAVFSGGTFLYIPENVKIDAPLQAYFRMNSMNQGQFEHTLIIVEKGASAHYIEGCSAPKYGSESLHAGCVEIFVEDFADFRYSSVENWSSDTYNLNTKRAIVGNSAKIEWVGGNFGSGVTMLYPCSILRGNNSQADHLGVAFAGKNQIQDTGAKIIIAGKNCRASSIAKSISKDGGQSIYRGLVQIQKFAENALVNVDCDALMMDELSVSDTVPVIKNNCPTASVVHEASAGKISEEVLLFFASRGINEESAKGIIVNGFLSEVVKTLPLEFASELNQIIEMEMEGSIG